MDIVADALGGVAVVAHAILLAGCVNVEAGSIDGRGRRAGTLQGSLHVLRHLVHADDEDDVLWSPCDGCHAVAVAVDVDDDAILRYGIGGRQVVVGMEGAEVHLLLLFGGCHGVAVPHVHYRYCNCGYKMAFKNYK